MGDKIKIGVLETNGVEEEEVCEIPLTADLVELNPTVAGYSDVKAWIEAQNPIGTAIGSLVPYIFATTGNTSNKWLGSYIPSTFSDEIPLLLMQPVLVKGVLFTNQDDDVDIDIEIYKNGTLAYTQEVRNKRFYYNVGISGPAFGQGDRMSVFLKKYTGGSGDSTAQDPVVQVIVKVTAESAGSGGQQTGVT